MCIVVSIVWSLPAALLWSIFGVVDIVINYQSRDNLTLDHIMRCKFVCQCVHMLWPSLYVMYACTLMYGLFVHVYIYACPSLYVMYVCTLMYSLFVRLSVCTYLLVYPSM